MQHPSKDNIDVQTQPWSECTAIVVPCYNEGKCLYTVIENLLQMAEHVIVIDDGSTEPIEKHLGNLKCRLVRFPKNRGKGHALLEGFKIAQEIEGVSCVVTIDSDGQHDPQEISNLYNAFQNEEAALVIGSRSFGSDNVPIRSRVGNVLTSRLTGILLGQYLPDTQSGFRLHSMPLIRDILKNIPGGRFETEMEIIALALRSKFKVVPVHISTIYEQGNKSSHFHIFRDSFLIYKQLLLHRLHRRN